MAEKATGAANSSKRSRLPLLLLLMLILIMAGAGGGYYYRTMHNQNSGKAEKSRPPPAPIFFQMDSFTVNLGDTDRVLYIGITLRMNDEETRAKVNAYLPEVRSRLLLLFSRQNSDDLATEQGKQTLIKEIKNVLAAPLEPGQPPQVITDVLYTTFILR